MILTAATVTGPLTSARRHVRGNLARGADHVVVFLDRPDTEVEAFLAGERHVTAVVCDDAWWGGHRPSEARQRAMLNANAASVLGRDFAWVFHLDADDVLDVDRDALAALPDDVRAVSLEPLQVVGRRSWDGDPTLFKPLLPDEDLALLQVLRIIPQATNKKYFHGAGHGRVGVRPGSRLGLAGHQVVRPTGKRVVPPPQPGLRVLRLEGASGTELVDAVAGGYAAGGRGQRVERALRALGRLDLEPVVRDELAMRVFERTRLDPEADLARLGLLEEVRLDQATHEPRPLERSERTAMERLLAQVRAADKREYRPKVVGDARRAAGESTGRSLLRRAARRIR